MSVQNNKSAEVVFLFGAGISIPIGIPAMAGIYRDFMNKKKSGISVQDKKTCEFFSKEMGVDNDLEEFLLAANTILEFRDSKLNRFVEKNISRTRSSAKMTEYHKNLNANLKDVQSIRTGILDFLSRVCFQFDRDLAMKVNSGFVETLSKLGYPVYSTNYDYAFEYVAIEKEIDIIDNFHKKGQRNLWNEKIDFEGESGFKLIKLHGSVTWYADGEGTIEKIYSSTNINPQGKEVEKIVIVPTRFKDIYEQHFFALYSHFLGSLAASKVIVIAGHSLRDDYLRAGIIERKRKGNFQIIVVDPQYPDEIKRELPPARLGSDGDIVHLPYKWEDISDELSNILLNSEPEDISKNCVNILKKDKYVKNKLKIKGNLGNLVALTPKKISIEIEAYLTATNKPSNLRAWLKASYNDSNGVAQNRITGGFIETKEVQYGTELSGLVHTNTELKINVPKINEWLEANCKVTLIIGLVKSSVKTPLGAKGGNVIALDEKELNYKN